MQQTTDNQKYRKMIEKEQQQKKRQKKNWLNSWRMQQLTDSARVHSPFLRVE